MKLREAMELQGPFERIPTRNRVLNADLMKGYVSVGYHEAYEISLKLSARVAFQSLHTPPKEREALIEKVKRSLIREIYSEIIPLMAELRSAVYSGDENTINGVLEALEREISG